MRRIMFNDLFGLTKAVLECRKTQTRRIMSHCIATIMRGRKKFLVSSHRTEEEIAKDLAEFGSIYSPYKVGEVIAIAQSYKDCATVGMQDVPGWTNKMFVRADLMPHHIEIERIRIEQLRDISEEDCFKEGVYQISGGRYKVDGLKFIGYDPITVYAELIDKIGGRDTWATNPLVFVYDFKLID